jgi:phasin
MAKDSMSSFEIPPEMRKFAEQSVTQARQAFDSFMAAANNAVTDMEGRAKVAREGARDISERAMSFAQRNIAASFDYAQRLVRARDAEEVMKLQSDYVKNQIQALNEQARELGEAAGKAAVGTTKAKS